MRGQRTRRLERSVKFSFTNLLCEAGIVFKYLHKGIQPRLHVTQLTVKSLMRLLGQFTTRHEHQSFIE